MIGGIMEEILAAYRNIKRGLSDSELYYYNNLSVNFSGNMMNIFDYSGEIPCGRFRLPVHEHALLTKLHELDEKIGDALTNDKYFCSKCGNSFENPPYKQDSNGFPVCQSCGNGGDIRDEKPSATKINKETTEDTKTVKKSRITVEEAIEFLKSQNYKISKMVKSFKVVASDAEGNLGVTDNYYRSKEEFEAKNPNLRFVSLVKELSTSIEEGVEQC